MMSAIMRRLLGLTLLIIFSALRVLSIPDATLFNVQHPRQSHLRRLFESERHRRLNIQLHVLEGCVSASCKIQQQNDVLERIKGFCRVEVLGQVTQLINAMFLRLEISNSNHYSEIDAWIRSFEDVSHLEDPQDYEPLQQWEVLEEAQVTQLQSNPYCLTGEGVVVGVIDTGVDYTHSWLGGEGTEEAYQAAYGTSVGSQENKRRDGLFPTDRVVEGYDFVGDLLNSQTPQPQIAFRQSDDDPIDGRNGHGTAVAAAVLRVAPHAQIVAAKACYTGALSGSGCPDFAILESLEYMLDIYRDGRNRTADIVNVSIGSKFTNGFFGILGHAISELARRGITPVIAASNHGNSPYILGDAAASPLAIAVGGTNGTTSMLDFSSRGPGWNNLLKPDISAPGGALKLAAAGRGQETLLASGTSFAAPLVAGAMALIRQHCRSCSQVALKSLLMNNANREVIIQNGLVAPVSWMGSGSWNVTKSLSAKLWAYCLEDKQPSFSLGLHNVARDFNMTRTLRITFLDVSTSIRFSVVFRDPSDRAAISVHLPSEPISPGICGSFTDVKISFEVHSLLVPPNQMTGGGPDALRPEPLDMQEFDGFVVVHYDEGDIALPFHSILRQAADVSLRNSVLPPVQGDEVTVANVGLVNHGVGVAQIDIFEVLVIDEDESEPGPGSNGPPIDFRFVGYRTVAVDQDVCDSSYLVEFAFHTWERARHPFISVLKVNIDNNGDRITDLVLELSVPFSRQSPHPESRISVPSSGQVLCTGFPIDHSTNTGNTVIRACSNDLGLDGGIGVYLASFESVSLPGVIVQDRTSWTPFRFPEPGLFAESFDIPGGSRWSDLIVYGPGKTRGRSSIGLMLVTNSYRMPTSTGSATRRSETLLLLSSDQASIEVPVESTPDVFMPLSFGEDIVGPQCNEWRDFSRHGCSAVTSWKLALKNSQNSLSPEPSQIQAFEMRQFQVNSNALDCPLVQVPRGPFATGVPSLSPRPTTIPFPSEAPQSSPTLSSNEAESASSVFSTMNGWIVLLVSGFLLTQYQ